MELFNNLILGFSVALDWNNRLTLLVISAGLLVMMAAPSIKKKREVAFQE